MTIHPLQRAYMQRIRLVYGVRVGLKQLIRPDEAAMKVARLGLDYDQFVEVACGLLNGLANARGWKYPYWNAMMCDSTFRRITDLLNAGTTVADSSDEYVEFQLELDYATDYILWYLGNSDHRPKRHNGRVPAKLRAEVSKHLCQTNGVEFIVPNYNLVAEAIEKSFE